MPRYGSQEWIRQKNLCTLMFAGFVFIVFYPVSVQNSGSLVGDLSLVVGIALFVGALVVLIRDRLRREENL